MSTRLDDARVRAAAFAFLNEATSRYSDVVPWAVLLQGFELDGIRIPLLSQQGIFKPSVLESVPLSIRTAPPDERKPRPYDDDMRQDGLLIYRYRGTDRAHRENAGLRQAMHDRTPLVYLFGIDEGEYMPVWPVYIVGDDPAGLSFTVAIDDRVLDHAIRDPSPVHVAEARRSYVTRLTVQRVHQRTFARRVLNAYQTRCAVCHLRRRELLDAAHILPDGHPLGEPIVPNGIALCKLHHAAFDSDILGVRPDLLIEVRRDILDEVDGPMLRHGLQEVAGTRLVVPRAPSSRPRTAFLEERYEKFRRAG